MMISFMEFLDESYRTDRPNDTGNSAKIDKEKSFTENYILLSKMVEKALKKASKSFETEAEKKAFENKQKDIKAVLKGYEILAKRIDKDGAGKDEITAIKNKFHYLMNFCKKK